MTYHHDEVRFIEAWSDVAMSAYSTAVEKGWWDTERSPAECIALMHSELSEALEGMRRPGPDKHCPEFDQVAVELADVVIRIMDFAVQSGTPVAGAMMAKMKHNRKREHRHGGALL